MAADAWLGPSTGDRSWLTRPSVRLVVAKLIQSVAGRTAKASYGLHDHHRDVLLGPLSSYLTLLLLDHEVCYQSKQVLLLEERLVWLDDKLHGLVMHQVVAS